MRTYVEGAKPAAIVSVMPQVPPRRGDLVVSRDLGALLRGFRLPTHEVIPMGIQACRGVMLARDRRYPDPLPWEWFWWTVPWGHVDFTRATFEVFEREGAVNTVQFDEYADYEQVRQRSERTGVAIEPLALVYRTTYEPDVRLDLRVGNDGNAHWLISDKLARALRDGNCAGVVMS